MDKKKTAPTEPGAAVNNLQSDMSTEERAQFLAQRRAKRRNGKRHVLGLLNSDLRDMHIDEDISSAESAKPLQDPQ